MRSRLSARNLIISTLVVLSIVFTALTLPPRSVMGGLPRYGVVICVGSVTICGLPGDYSCCVSGGSQ